MTGPRTPFRPDSILRALAKAGVRFVVIGGVAASLRGSPLLTVDLDICPDRSPDNLLRLEAALRGLAARRRDPGTGRTTRFPVEADFLAQNDIWTVRTRSGDLDLCFLPDGTGGFPDLSRDATRVEIRGLRVLAASLADVIRSKEAANRPKDQAVLATLRELLARERRPARRVGRRRRRA